jgi:hypothetical protein
MTAEEERALEYRRQCERRAEFQEFLEQKLQGDDFAYQELLKRTRAAMQGEEGDGSYD